MDYTNKKLQIALFERDAFLEKCPELKPLQTMIEASLSTTENNAEARLKKIFEFIQELQKRNLKQVHSLAQKFEKTLPKTKKPTS